jgi:Putative transposase
MVEAAAHFADHVVPCLTVRQWVLCVPKRLRYFLRRDGATLNLVLRIFPRVIAQGLQANCLGAANAKKAALHVDAVAHIHRFGPSLNEYEHFHVCVVDGVFGEPADGTEVDTDHQSSLRKVIFHPASGIDADAMDQVQATLRRRVLRAFVGRGLLRSFEAKDILACCRSGFSVDDGVCIDVDDRAALERLLRYCACPPFSMERLCKAGIALVYHSTPTQPEPDEPIPPKRSPAHYLWAVLIARIYEVCQPLWEASGDA